MGSTIALSFFFGTAHKFYGPCRMSRPIALLGLPITQKGLQSPPFSVLSVFLLSRSSPMIRRLCTPLPYQTLTKPNHISSLFTRKPTGHHSLSFTITTTTTTTAVPQRHRRLPLLSATHQRMSANDLHSVPIPSVEKASKLELVRALESSLKTTFATDPIQPPPSPLVVVISGPSGVGKDAVINKLRETRSNLHFVVTATSRPMRPGEVDGKDYIFVSKEEFLRMVQADQLLEYALVYGDYKGVPKNQIRDFISKGCDVVLRVDIQGAKTLKKILGDSAVFVFVVAASEMEMVERLIDRRTESREDLHVRVATSREEMKHIKNFDYVVVNSQGKLDEAVRLLESIIDAEKAKVGRRNVVI